MTKLEIEIAAAMFGDQEGITGISEEMSKAAAKVAMKYIEDAFYAGARLGSIDKRFTPVHSKMEWLKENGITNQGPNIETVSPAY